MSSRNIRRCQDLEDTSDKTFFVDTNAIGNTTLSWIQDRCLLEGKQTANYLFYMYIIYVSDIKQIQGY